MIQYLRSFGLFVSHSSSLSLQEASTIISYFLSFFLLSLITSILFEVFGFVYQVHYLINLPYGVPFLLFTPHHQFTTFWCTLYLTGMCYVGYFIVYLISFLFYRVHSLHDYGVMVLHQLLLVVFSILILPLICITFSYFLLVIFYSNYLALHTLFVICLIQFI